MRRLILLAAFACSAWAAEWTEYRSGPFHVFSNAGDKPSRELLTDLEQFRFEFAAIYGKKDFKTVWPVYFVLFANQKDYAPYALPETFVEGRAATFTTWIADTPIPPDFLRGLGKLLMEANCNRLPAALEAGLLDLFSTLDVKATHITIGAPPPPERRTMEWAKLQLFATNPDYSGRLRVYLSNLEQGGDEGLASRNAFDKPKAEVDKIVAAYLAAGKFETKSTSGFTINPQKDYIEIRLGKEPPRVLMGDLLLAGGKTAQAKEMYAGVDSVEAQEGLGLVAMAEKNHDEAYRLFDQVTTAKTKSARAWMSLGLVEKNPGKASGFISEATTLNPLWAEPWVQMARIDDGKQRKAFDWKQAATRQPRNAEYWQAYAKTALDAKLFQEAGRAWVLAERAAASPEERERIHDLRLKTEDERAAAEAAERKRIADERVRELEALKAGARAEIHAAEQAANQRLTEQAGGAPVPQAIEQWWQETAGDNQVIGLLENVDCSRGAVKLEIRVDKQLTRVLVKDLSTVPLKGASALGCGVQKPARQVAVGYQTAADRKSGTIGEALSIEFHDARKP
ncbi:MAG: hypothetical protein ABI823_04395 [Bryobacteraceae bacterium]